MTPSDLDLQLNVTDPLIAPIRPVATTATLALAGLNLFVATTMTPAGRPTSRKRTVV